MVNKSRAFSFFHKSIYLSHIIFIYIARFMVLSSGQVHLTFQNVTLETKRRITAFGHYYFYKNKCETDKITVENKKEKCAKRCDMPNAADKTLPCVIIIRLQKGKLLLLDFDVDYLPLFSKPSDQKSLEAPITRNLHCFIFSPIQGL